MAEQGQQTRTPKIHAWALSGSAIAIAISIGTLCLSVVTFLYKDWYVPKSAPINITVDLELKKVGESGLMTTKSKHTLVPVEMRISAKNPSPRQVFLLPSCWIAWGVKIRPSAAENSFKNALDITSENRTPGVERHVVEARGVVVGYGGLIQDTVLKPNETTTRSLIFYVPPNEYDSIRVLVGIPTIDRKGAAQVEWHFNEKDGELDPTVYKIGSKGERIPMKPDKEGAYTDPQIGLQESGSMAELSLW